MSQRLNISSGTRWESEVGYSRAVRMGNLIEVAGTTAIDENGRIVGQGSAYEQTKYALSKIAKALAQAGASMSDVIRTRIYVTDIALWEEVGKAHGECFRDIRPAATMVEVSALIEPGLLIEIEATALLGTKNDD